jgi:hypothetical protein
MEAATALQPAASPLAPTPVPPTLDETNKVEKAEVTATKPKDQTTARIGELEGKFEETEGKLDAINKETGALQPPKYDLPKFEPPKKTDPVAAWASPAMALAAIGSLLTRTPMTTALNAAAGVMKAFKENDREAEDTAFQQWKQSTELANKQQTFQLEAYKAALAKASTDEKGALAQFTAYAHAFGDETAALAAQTRGLQGAEHVTIDYQRMMNAAMEKMPQILEGKALHDAVRDPAFQAKLKAAKTPEEKADIMAKMVEKVAPDMAQSGGIISDERLRSMAEQYVAGDHTVTQGMGYGKSGQATRARLQNMIGTVMTEQGMSGSDAAAAKAEFAGMMAAERTLGTVTARIGLGAAELQKLEPQVEKASEELKRSNYPSLNAAIQAGERATGDPKLKSLAVRLQGLKSAFSQVLTRGGATTDAARAATDELFSTTDPVSVMQSAMGALNDETGAIEQAPGVVRDRLRSGLGGNKNAKASYKSADDVKAAVHAGKLTHDQGVDILKSQFGYDD